MESCSSCAIALCFLLDAIQMRNYDFRRQQIHKKFLLLRWEGLHGWYRHRDGRRCQMRVCPRCFWWISNMGDRKLELAEQLGIM